MRSQYAVKVAMMTSTSAALLAREPTVIVTTSIPSITAEEMNMPGDATLRTYGPQTVYQTVPPAVQTETVYIVPQSQQQGVTVITVYQTYAYTIAKRSAAPEPTQAPGLPSVETETKKRRCKVLVS
ncbi:hypothetical protein V8E51_019311 [Hyaloscypha variabilis]